MIRLRFISGNACIVSDISNRLKLIATDLYFAELWSRYYIHTIKKVFETSSDLTHSVIEYFFIWPGRCSKFIVNFTYILTKKYSEVIYFYSIFFFRFINNFTIEYGAQSKVFIKAEPKGR